MPDLKIMATAINLLINNKQNYYIFGLCVQYDSLKYPVTQTLKSVDHTDLT